jgi:hypothetical protein
MVRSELVKKSPLRILEKSLSGGQRKGNIAVLASRKGVGKTACLVHIATDKLLQGNRVLHVSFAGRTDHIISWYENVFSELAKKRNLESAMSVHEEIIKNRVIMNFTQDGVGIDQVLSSLRAMIVEGQFSANLLIVDGYDLAKSEPDDLDKLRSFALDVGLEIWLSVSLKGEDPLFDEKGIPFVLRDILDKISYLITLQPEERKIKLRLVKDSASLPNEDLNLMLDARTFLIAEED